MTERSRPVEVISRFRSELISEHGRRAHRLPRVLVATAAGAAFAVAAVIGLGGSGTDDALAITKDTETIVVRIADTTAGPRELTDDLQKAGINAVVLAAPATQDKVGTWVKVTSPRVASPATNTSIHDQVDEELEAKRASERISRVAVSGTEVRIPTDFDDPLVLVVGVPQKAGQQAAF